jgi:hypothetical protein
MHLGSSCLVLVMLLVLCPAQARVTHETLLCLPANGPWLTRNAETKLRAVAQAIPNTESHVGVAVATVTSVAAAPDGVEPKVAARLGMSVVHWLRVRGHEIGEHRHLRGSPGADPREFGCAAGHVALEVAIVFPHPIYK